MAEYYENFLFKEDTIDEVLDMYNDVEVLAIGCESDENGKECAIAYINDNGNYKKIELTGKRSRFTYYFNTIPTLLNGPMHKISKDFDMFNFHYITLYIQLNMKYLKGISYRVIEPSKKEKTQENNLPKHLKKEYSGKSYVIISADFDNNVSMFIMGCRYKEFKGKLYDSIENFTSRYNIYFEKGKDNFELISIPSNEKNKSLSLNND